MYLFRDPQLPLKYVYPALRATHGPFLLLRMGVKLGLNFCIKSKY